MRGRRLVLACYILSGACGLVYEVVWTRRLSLTFGITVFATSTVLAAFMAGLGLGSYLVARRIDRSPNPVRVYALLEVGIGLYALAVPWIFDALEPLYTTVARAAVAFAVLLVPTTMMGGTVPAIGRYLVRHPGSVGWNVGLLYALNTLGAVAGCLAAGFVLVASLGMSGTIALTAAANVALGALLLLAGVGADGAERPAPGAAPAVTSRAVRLAVFVFAASGFSALAYEVVWTRVLVVYVHNTTYAFSVMLAVFLAGLTLGDVLLMRAYDRVRRPLRWLGGVEVLIGLSVIAAAAAYVQVPTQELTPVPHSVQVPARFEGGLLRLEDDVATQLLQGEALRDAPLAGVTSWREALGVMFTRSGLVLLPGALLFGMTFPLVARVVCFAMGTLGRDLGGAYAANTFGAIVGSLAGGFLLVPAFGLRGTLVVLSGLNIALGGLCWVADAQGRRRALVAAATVALVALPAAAIPPHIFFDALQFGALRLVYYYEGVTDTTGVWESTVDGSRIVTYGDMRGTAGTHSDYFNRSQGHLAHLLHPRPTRSLQIGFGVGNTLAAAALHPEVEQLDCAELSPHVRQTAPYFWTNDDVLANPKVHLIVDDGRNYLLRTRERYQVITLEPPDIFTAAVVNLYTEEFYRLAARALTDDGLLCQWIPPGEMSELDVQMLVRAFLDVFPETTLWEEGRPGPLLLIGTKRPLRIDVADLARRVQREPVHADLVRLRYPDAAAILDLFIAGPERTRQWVADVPPVTDDHTFVDFSTPKRLYSGFGLGYFRLRGEEADTFRAHVASTQALYQRLREPVTSLLVSGREAPRYSPARYAASASRQGRSGGSPSAASRVPARTE